LVIITKKLRKDLAIQIFLTYNERVPSQFIYFQKKYGVGAKKLPFWISLWFETAAMHSAACFGQIQVAQSGLLI
jgi:hypothetical protein